MDIDEEVIGTWPNVAIEAGSDLKAMKPAPVENRSVFDEPEEPEATPARFSDAPKDILSGESYKLDDTRELLEADINYYLTGKIPKWATNIPMLNSTVLYWLDRQAAITERQCMERATSERVGWDCAECAEGLGKRIAELTADVESQRKRANDAERGVLSEAWYVSRDRYEDDIAELRHANSLLQSTIAELGVKVDEKQAELLEARAARNADPVEIQLALARFADEWTTTDTRAQEQRLITYYARQIAQLVDNHTENA